MRVRRLDHFGVDVADLARAERFYTDVLGMSVQMRLADQVLMQYDGGACALFLKPDRPQGTLDRKRTRMLGLEETPAASAHRRGQRASVPR